MIKAAIEKLLAMAIPPNITVDGREYSTVNLAPVLEPEPKTIYVHTLTGLLDYLCDIPGAEEVCSHGEPFIHVADYNEVLIRSAMWGPFSQRMTYLCAEPPQYNSFQFGAWLTPESFIINLQSRFVQTQTTEWLISMVSSIKDEAVNVSLDDSYSQTVKARTGVALVTEVKVPNPVVLRPYRTFMEIEQPAISCVLRLRQGPELALFEADGGLWRLEAIASIDHYLKAALSTRGREMRVVA